MFSCPSCGQKKFTELSFGGYVYQEKQMPLVRCHFCQLKYVCHNLTQFQIDEFYNRDSYFDSEYIGGAGGEYQSNKLAMEMKADKVFSVLHRIRPSGKLLDIGCAGGFSLALAKEKYGYESFGVEVSKTMAESAKKRGVTIACGSIDAVPASWGRFDAIYLGDVLEHVPDPNPFIQKIKSRLSLRGVVAIEVPLSYNLTLSGILIGILNLCRGRWGYQYFLPAQHRTHFIPKPPYHLLMFNNKSMRYFLEHNGFKVVYMKVYEGEPKQKFGTGVYASLKYVTHKITSGIKQPWFGDRMLVVGIAR